MRKIALFLSALVATLVAVPAQAQVLDRVLGVLGGATAYGYNSCSYVNGGIQQASCQANRAVTVVNTLRQAEQNARYRQQERFNRRTQQLTALQRACQAGDAESCARSGGADGRQMEVARALMDACSAGDKRSCGRAEAMMDERNVASYEPRGGYERQSYRQPSYQDRGYAPAPVRYAQAPRAGGSITIEGYDPARGGTQNCRPAIDPRTGYRVAGRFDCR